jgi:predicted dehydrogenase
VSMRIAVLGLGFMGSTHLKAWQNVPNAKLVAVFGRNDRQLNGDFSHIQGNLGGPGEKFDFSEVAKYRDLNQLLADPAVDAVDICLPTHLHSATAIAALQAGKHVLLEKPFALTGEAADSVLKEAERARRTLMGAQVLRFVPAYKALTGALHAGSYGPVRSAFFRRRCAAPFWSTWLGDASQSGGGIFDLLIHDVDYCISVFGVPTAVSATGYEDLAGGIDIIMGHLHYDHIPSVMITGGWHHKKSYPFSMEFTVATDGGTFEYSSLRGNEVTLYAADGEMRQPDIEQIDCFEAELRYFTDCVTKGERPSLCPPEESAKAVKVALLLREARNKNGEKISCQV